MAADLSWKAFPKLSLVALPVQASDLSHSSSRLG